MAKPPLFPTSRSYIPNFFFEVARGAIDNTSYEHKFGHNDSVGATWETMWNDTNSISYLVAASVLKISCSNVNDTSAGTGVKTINIEGLDANYNIINEDVTLNGQTAVNTTKSYLRVHRMRSLTAGSGGENAGVIYAGTGAITIGVPANIYGIINPTFGQSLMGFYTIPAGFTGYLYNFIITSSISKESEARLMVRELGGVFNVKDHIDILNNDVGHEWIFPLKIPEKSDVEVQAQATGGGGNMSTSFTLLIVKE